MSNATADIEWKDDRSNGVKHESATENLAKSKSLLNEMGNNLDMAKKELNQAQERLAVASSLYRKMTELVYNAYNDVESIVIDD